MDPIPVFIITRDRLTVLGQSLQSYYDNIETPIVPVIHDNSSTFGPTVKYLKTLEDSGITVYRHKGQGLKKGCGGTIDEAPIAASIEDFKRRYSFPYYVVTDPDIELDNTPGDILEFYAFLLDKFSGVRAVGPMLRIDDVPDHYPKRNQVFQRHNRHWKQPRESIAFRGNTCQYQRTPLTSTFALYRRDFVFERYKKGIRTHAPYVARHLDWYLDPNNLAKDQVYYAKHGGRNWAHVKRQPTKKAAP